VEILNNGVRRELIQGVDIHISPLRGPPCQPTMKSDASS
jgi:hypothetical protein